MDKQVIWHIATSAPRILVQLASVAAIAGLATSCVPAKQYEQARGAAEAHAKAQQQESEHRVALEAENQRLGADLDRARGELETERANLAASKLESTVALKEREVTAELVTQLQSDLARAGDHLAWFSNEKRDLGKALLLAEQRSDDVERANVALDELLGMSRDLALLLGENQGMGELTLGSKNGKVVLEVPESQLFAEGSDALVVAAAPVLAAVARASNQHAPLKLSIQLPAAGELQAKRGAHLIDALVERGVPRERLSSEAPIEATPAGEQSYAFGFMP